MSQLPQNIVVYECLTHLDSKLNYQIKLNTRLSLLGKPAFYPVFINLPAGELKYPQGNGVILSTPAFCKDMKTVISVMQHFTRNKATRHESKNSKKSHQTRNDF